MFYVQIDEFGDLKLVRAAQDAVKFSSKRMLGVFGQTGSRHLVAFRMSWLYLASQDAGGAPRHETARYGQVGNISDPKSFYMETASPKPAHTTTSEVQI